MNIQSIDNFQSRHPVIAFPIAVIKKYGDDRAGDQAALLTYYGFLALFPLLLVVTTLLQIVATSHHGLQTDVINAVTGNSSALGNQLSAHIHSLHRNGLALVVGIIFLLYGARGIAGAFRNGANRIWRVPDNQLTGFPRSTFIDITTMLIGGLGLVIAAGITATVAAVGYGWLSRGLSYIAGILVLYGLFSILFRQVLAQKVVIQEIRLAAIITAVGLVIMQILGGYILGRVLRNLDALYSYFAISLGLLFWIYLQAQVTYYAIEIAIVKHQKLWPIKMINE